MNWDKRWMSMAHLVSTWSKDRSRQCGAVIVDNRGVVVSIGWNGFPRDVDDAVEERHERPAKYDWTEHAERNALYNAAAKGNSTLGCTMYLNWYPCTPCARGIKQSGISAIVCIEPNWNDPTYGNDFKVTKEMLKEAGVNVRFVPGEAPIRR